MPDNIADILLSVLNQSCVCINLNRRSTTIDYTNWRGERAIRRISPYLMFFGNSEFHEKDQWLIDAYDLERSSGTNIRTFALAGIHSWKVDQPNLKTGLIDADSSTADS